MKKFMLRGHQKYAISDEMPSSLKYNTWYEFVTPFYTCVFKLKKGSRVVNIYTKYNLEKPFKTYSRNRFIRDILPFAKSYISEYKKH